MVHKYRPKKHFSHSSNWLNDILLDIKYQNKSNLQTKYARVFGAFTFSWEVVITTLKLLWLKLNGDVAFLHKIQQDCY